MYQKTIFHLISILVLIQLISCIEKKKTAIELIELNYDFRNYMYHEREKKDLLINERNIFSLKCDSLGNCTHNNKKITIKEIKTEIIASLSSKAISYDSPSLIFVKLKHAGNVFIPDEYIVSAHYHPNLNYLKYSEIRNEIFNAYYEVRNEFSKTKYQKSIRDLAKSKDQIDIERLKEIYSIYPIRYTESRIMN